MASSSAKIDYNKVFLSKHPVLQHKLTLLRDKSTNSNTFRLLLNELTFYLGYEATRDCTVAKRDFEAWSSQARLRTIRKRFRGVVRQEDITIHHHEFARHDMQSPVGKGEGQHLSTRIALVPILRAGLGMVDAMLNLVPSSEVHHIGMYREHNSLCPVMYYNRLPQQCENDVAIVLEPMIATAGTINATLGILKDWGVPKIKIMCIIASTAGLAALQQEHPDVEIHVAGIDNELTEEGYVIPGLGDVGDRIFRTFEGKRDPHSGGVKMSGTPAATEKKRKRGN